MKKLVIDIETVGIPWDELDPYVREYLIKGLSEGDAEEARRAGGLSPFRGRIVAICPGSKPIKSAPSRLPG